MISSVGPAVLTSPLWYARSTLPTTFASVAQREVQLAEAVRLQVRVLEAFVLGLLVCAFAMQDLEREAHMSANDTWR